MSNIEYICSAHYDLPNLHFCIVLPAKGMCTGHGSVQGRNVIFENIENKLKKGEEQKERQLETQTEKSSVADRQN
jgi:hypothetical protein